MTTSAPERPSSPTADDAETASDARASAVGAAETIVVVDPRPRLVLAVIGLALALLCGAIAIGGGLLGGSSDRTPPQRFALEHVDDGTLQLDEAVRRLERLGLVVDTEYVPNERLARGTVSAQRPQAGAKVEQGSVIKLSVSDGPAGTVVPGVVGQQFADAALSLAGVTLTFTRVERPDERIAAGEVISSRPEPGARVQPGASVELVVSQGPPPRIVPEALGRKIEEVLVDLGRAGLSVGKIDRPFRTDIAPGTVLDASPPAGSGVPRDMPIDLVVATDRPPVPVPYLVGLRSASAQSLLKNAGLAVSITLQPVDPNSPQVGTVVGQGVPPWSKVTPGATIEIRVGDPSLPATTVAPAPTTTVR